MAATLWWAQPPEGLSTQAWRLFVHHRRRVALHRRALTIERARGIQGMIMLPS
jgi:hypothetical protein